MAVWTLSRKQAEEAKRLERLRAWVVRYACNKLRCDTDTAEDLAQNTLCALCQAYPDLAEVEEMQRMSRTIIRHFHFRGHRRKGGRDILSLESLLGEDSEVLAGMESSPHTQAEARENREQVRLAIQSLPQTYRSVLSLTCEGHDGQEIAEALGISHAAVRTRLNRARTHLRRLLNSQKENSTSL